MGQEPYATIQEIVRAVRAVGRIVSRSCALIERVLDAFARRSARRGTVAFRTPPTKRRLLALRFQGLVPAMAGAEDPPPPEPTPTPEPPKPEPKKEEPKTYDQEYVTGLRGEAADWRTKYQALDKEKREREDADKTELQRAVDRGDTAVSERDEARTELWRMKAAVRHGIPEDLVDLITGSTEEEMQDRAERLSRGLGGTRQERVPAPPRNAKKEPQQSLDEQIAEAEEKKDWARAGQLKAQKLAEPKASST